MLNLNQVMPREKEIIKKKDAVMGINHAKTLNDGQFPEAWEFLKNKGCINDDQYHETNYENINGVWRNEPCFIIACGSALKDFVEKIGFDFLNNRHTIGINHVIEDYDKLEWFFFLDHRFLAKTTYDLCNFKGRVFSKNTAGYKRAYTDCSFVAVNDEPKNFIEDGLFSGNLSGLAALNLAIITGANPIYLLGYGRRPNTTKTGYHYKNNYPGEIKNDIVFNKMDRVNLYFKKFERWSGRIIHVTEGNDLPWFKKMRIHEFKRKYMIGKVEVKKDIPKIIHFSFSDKVSDHADITRGVISNCYGTHELKSIHDGVIPAADLYILEHFLSTDKFVQAFPYKHKALNIVHTVNCIPPSGMKKNIALTDTWSNILTGHGVDNIETIRGGINIDEYKSIDPAHVKEKQVFGRITRWSPGKIPEDWGDMVRRILAEIPESKCIIYTQLDQAGKRIPVQHERMIYDKSCQIDMFKGQFLKNLSVYVHANNTFKETLSFAVIEAMATGLPIVYLKETGVIREVTGGEQIECKNLAEVEEWIKKLLLNPELRYNYGLKAKERAKFFDIKKMIESFDHAIKECLK
jgi:glycosyltransferase involved in cell wall biosynthesis